MSFPRVWARLIIDKLAEKVPPEKRRLVLIVSIGFFAVFLLALIGSLLLAGGDHEGKKPAAPEKALLRQGFIPPDDLFLPEEPDFIPGVLLEREQRTEWTASDAEPLWQDPLKSGEEPWRNQIEKTIEEIMESVP
ncbi:MAG: hypothetical protein FWC24_01315 [Treponema sp.]|nr:hypothetical protein [Treponema sp.]